MSRRQLLRAEYARLWAEYLAAKGAARALLAKRALRVHRKISGGGR